ncbi:MAG: single-stranded DNA-binding protein, partial [Dehalococcoidia bacterium]
IAERGVQLIGTAHGNTLENLMMNPTLSDLIGGIQSVTLSDEEAKRRGTQKSILERRAPPTFDIVVEIQEWDKVAIHPDVDQAVDAVLRGQPTATEIRWLNENGEVRIEKEEPVITTKKAAKRKQLVKGSKTPKLYLFGVNRGRLEQMARERQLNLDIVNNLNDANLFVTSKSYYRRKLQKVRDAEAANLPIYVLRSNTPHQIRQLLSELYPLESVDKTSPLKLALSEAEEAVARVKEGQEAIELSPQSAYIRRLQHLLAERNKLSSQSTGTDPNRRVRIYREVI